MDGRDLAAAMMRLLEQGYSIEFHPATSASLNKIWATLYDPTGASCANGFDHTRAEALAGMFADLAYMRL